MPLVLTGRFHPHLESALCDQIARAKRADPFAAVAIVVPSRTLLQRVQQLLAVDRSLALLNVHVLTFHQLALRIAAEGPAPVAPVRIVADLFFEHLTRHIVRNRLTGLTPLQHLADSAGTWTALWATLSDLVDGGVAAPEALRAVHEQYFGRDDGEWLRALFTVYAGVKEAARSLEVGTADDFARAVTPAVPSSIFLKQMREVIYYGVYDLTQAQLSLFEAVSHTVPVTIVFPLDDEPAFEFARRFFERHLQPMVGGSATITRVGLPICHSGSSGPGPVELVVRSAAGTDEELALVCRTILDLVETQGYRFDEIGVVARTLEPYAPQLKSVLDRHRIPFTTTLSRTLIHEPVCKVLVQLASLRMNDYYRTAVLDVIMSHRYRGASGDRDELKRRPDQWKIVLAILHITRGLDEWDRLRRVNDSGLDMEETPELAGRCERWNVAAEVIEQLRREVDHLITACEELPERGSITVMIEALAGLVDTTVQRPGEELSEDAGTIHERAVWAAIDAVLSELHELEPMGEELTWESFVSLLVRALERASVPVESGSHGGVAVLDAMAARGIPFKTLFVVGLNDKIFPRFIREDAFLRDRHRAVLDDTLGFKVDEKLDGYEEESLLFALLCQSAGRKLFLSFQRSDEQGRPLAPSPYLETAGRLLSVDQPPVEVSPRRLTERIRQRPFLRHFLPPDELIRWAALNGSGAVQLSEALGRDAKRLLHAMEVLAQIENEDSALTPFDGMTGLLQSHGNRIAGRGMAPTPLERYARCPFQYFSSDVLKLEPLAPPTRQAVDAAVLGTLAHAALRLCYGSLISSAWPLQPLADPALTALIHESVELAARECEERKPAGPYLLWELAKETVEVLMRAAIESDLNAFREDGYIPEVFEVEHEGVVPDVVSKDDVPLKVHLKVHGRVDRIDRRPDTQSVRIVDYKFKMGSTMTATDRQLLQAAVRGFRLQPPVYAHMAVEGGRIPHEVQFMFLAPGWSEPVTKVPFHMPARGSDQYSRLHDTMQILLDGILAGRFFMIPDAYCNMCDYRTACRLEHSPSWWRTYRSDEFKGLKGIRSLRVNDA
ncbi:ATP-dependent helicase/deoxyribonuclease subunit B [Nitrospira sp. KM1]|uniref:PD-(D/E)XK nuclease family protein n=1 Tax=Nitrospira sp. KM1 TaxID=1936990 RepID=UPI0013A772EE|nr:PD-(D/E)XK nuclease family protein [Nitrospira sp. KM1]BCA53492.1 ATP-dependent helicase/deoxyribonuclease subunit B [Nitrospira sp. KM1]